MIAAICAPLKLDDYLIQSIVDTSPPKWHLAHVTWFHETFLLLDFLPNYQSLNPDYSYLFNSYYQTVGNMHAREHVIYCPVRLLNRSTIIVLT